MIDPLEKVRMALTTTVSSTNLNVRHTLTLTLSLTSCGNLPVEGIHMNVTDHCPTRRDTAKYKRFMSALVQPAENAWAKSSIGHNVPAVHERWRWGENSQPEEFRGRVSLDISRREAKSSAPVMPSNRNSYQWGVGLSGVGPKLK
jgi:hypothetical protein